MSRALPTTLLRTPLRIAAGCALANALWSAFLWQQLLVARSGGEAFCAFGGGCGALWDGPFASAVHAATGLPVAGWGLAWSLAALALTGWTLRSVGSGSDPEPAWSGVVLSALAGIGSVVGLGAVSALEGGFCSNCAVTYALVLAFAGVVLAAAWAARPRAWSGGAVRAGAAVAVAFAVLLFPGLQTPRAGSHLGGGALVDAGGGARASIADLARLIETLPPAERQKLSNAMAHYRAAKEVTVRSPRALLGAPMAPVRVTTFTDSGCSHCAYFHEGLERALSALPPRSVAVDQRVFPLDRSCNEHVQAGGREEVCLAARVRLCLEDDDRSWELTGWLHSDAQPLGAESIYRVAERLGPRAQIEACVGSAETANKMRDDIAFALEAGIMGTPFILVNGRPSPTYLPFIYALGLTAGDADHPVFASLPPPVEEEAGHEGHGH